MKALSHMCSILVLALLVVAPIKGDLVACIGSDGHQKIEISSMGNCISCLEIDHHAEPMAPFEDGSDHCGDCTDIPLISQLIQAEKKTWQAPVHVNLGKTVKAFIALERHEVTPQLLPIPPPTNPVDQSMEQIILLI